jgi:exodeoxyribonuclease-5
MDLSPDQVLALKTLTDFSLSNKQSKGYITLGGYAGTGKTTLISELRKKIFQHNPKFKVGLVAFTGKAVQVLKNKLTENQTLIKKDDISTIHSLIYRTIEDDRGGVIGWELKDKDEIELDLLIVDEASMIEEKIWNDLLSFEIPIIAVGDHGQLPPINGNFNLMTNPELKLENIHRQALENPIIQISILARNSVKIPHQKWSQNVKKIPLSEGHEYYEDLFSSYNFNTLILCNFNHTRIRINESVRKYLGFESKEPQKKDRVICLRNNHEKQIFNGMQGSITYLKNKTESSYEAEIEMDYSSKLYSGIISKDQFHSNITLNNINKSYQTQRMDLFDFGYALTVHKAQGSSAKKVILFEERNKYQTDEDFSRWLYTGVTRAEEELIIFG